MKKMSDLEKKLNAIPDATKGKERKWTLEMDSAILRFCPTKGYPAVSRILGVPSSTVRARLKYLQGRVGK